MDKKIKYSMYDEKKKGWQADVMEEEGIKYFMMSWE